MHDFFVVVITKYTNNCLCCGLNQAPPSYTKVTTIFSMVLRMRPHSAKQDIPLIQSQFYGLADYVNLRQCNINKGKALKSKQNISLLICVNSFIGGEYFQIYILYADIHRNVRRDIFEPPPPLFSQWFSRSGPIQPGKTPSIPGPFMTLLILLPWGNATQVLG